jgi:sugar/nucleoside kinase (ribokinase family)
MVDVVVRPAAPPQPGTDVPGRIELRAGGSAANTARWLARLGGQAVLIASVGRDAAGRALAASLRRDGVSLHLARPRGSRTGRIGVLVGLDGERAFVADRGAADELRPVDLRPAWLAGARLLHLPAYSLLTEPLRQAADLAVDMARAERAQVSLDLASSGPLLTSGRLAAMQLVRRVSPDLLFATAGEARALTGLGSDEGGVDEAILALAPLVVLKRGASGATVVALDPQGHRLRLDVPARRISVTDSTGAGDAFDAGFIAARLNADTRGRVNSASFAAGLRRATLAGHRAARRQLADGLPELRLL